MKKNIGKILIIVLPVIFALIFLIPTYRADQLESEWQKVKDLAAKEKDPADSLALLENWEKEFGANFQSAKNNRLKLGLDLRGGMYVTLEVDLVKLLREHAKEAMADPKFAEIMEKTDNESKNSEEAVIDIFVRNFRAMLPNRTLTSYFDFGEAVDTDDKVISRMKDEEKEAIDQALEVIRQRIDKYGIAEPTIQKQGTRRIMLEMPGVTNENEMHQLLKTSAVLEFKLVRSDENLCRAFRKIDQLVSKSEKIKKGLIAVDTTAKDSTSIASDTTKGDSLKKAEADKPDTGNPYAGMSQEDQVKKYQEDHPFTSMFMTYFWSEDRKGGRKDVDYVRDVFQPGDYFFEIMESQMRKFKEIMSRREVLELMPDDVHILMGAKPREIKDNSGKTVKVYEFYGVKKEPEMTGEKVVNAQATYDPQTNAPVVMMGMNDEGADMWGKITGANLKKRIAIVLDSAVYSAPTVQSKIMGGSSQITGMSSPEEAKLLKTIIKAGALKAPVKIIEERIVGASLGDDSISDGLTASAIAFAAVILFMLIYYSAGGFIADLSVIINVWLLLGIIAAFQGTLTLPGIAGIILTVGMAVDANVLIFERIREELFRGRSLKSAVDEGYRKALSAILDSNITTFITGFILYFLGTGSVKGFALTLMLGIITTLFSQIFISRAFVEIMLSRGATSLSFGQPKVKVQQ